MSELKAHKIGDLCFDFKMGKDVGIDFYLKSEADKVIAHQKYKRCLAMAKWCLFWKNYWHCCKPSDVGAFIAREKFFCKWHKRWLKIAEKFKEEK